MFSFSFLLEDFEERHCWLNVCSAEPNNNHSRYNCCRIPTCWSWKGFENLASRTKRQSAATQWSFLSFRSRCDSIDDSIRYDTTLLLPIERKQHHHWFILIQPEATKQPSGNWRDDANEHTFNDRPRRSFFVFPQRQKSKNISSSAIVWSEAKSLRMFVRTHRIRCFLYSSFFLLIWREFYSMNHFFFFCSKSITSRCLRRKSAWFSPFWYHCAYVHCSAGRSLSR